LFGVSRALNNQEIKRECHVSAVAILEDGRATVRKRIGEEHCTLAKHFATKCPVAHLPHTVAGLVGAIEIDRRDNRTTPPRCPLGSSMHSKI
jgi:hypothetical protein